MASRQISPGTPRRSGDRGRSSRQRGFTLIELLVTLMVIGVLAGITVSTSGWLQSRHLATETQALRQRLEALRQLAVSTRQSWRLCALGADGQCGSDWSRGYRWDLEDGDGGRLAGQHTLEGVMLDWNNGSRLTFTSTPWRFHSSLGSFSICNDSGGNRLALNDAGRVTLDHGNRSDCP